MPRPPKKQKLQYPRITFRIKDIEWSLIVKPSKDYEKDHGSDSHANTEFGENCIYVDVASLNLVNILHELGHAYFASCMTNSADLSPLAVEEIFCEIIGAHATELVSLGRRLLRTSQKRIEAWP